MNSRLLIADLSTGRSRLRITGNDRVSFLHGQCTNDILRLQTGKSCYATFLDAKGKMRGEANIVCLDDGFLLDANIGLQPSLERFVITEDVTIKDVSDTYRLYLVVGDEKLPADAVKFAHPLGTGVITAARLSATLDVPLLDALRIEAGIPAWGVDMDENTIPVEAGLASRAISYDKGCYIGQETIARIKTYGHVNRQLVQFSVSRSVARGDRLLAGDKEVGQITSAAFSNRLGKTLALGYVRREFAMVGTGLTIGRCPAEVLKVCGQ